MTVAASESGVKFGPWQGLLLLVGYLLAQVFGPSLMLIFEALSRRVAHRAPLLPAGAEDPRLLACGVLIGFLLSAAWAVFYVRHQARPLLRRGEATGIAWRPPHWQAYGTSLLVAVSAIAFASLMVTALPPDTSKLTGPMSKLLDAPGLPRLTVQFMAVVGAPLVEEFVFRGALFAALARGWGARWAGLGTTLVFVVLHAPDKAGWWPGFLVIGFLGALLVALRVCYKSLWPGMLAHFLYNSSFLVLS